MSYIRVFAAAFVASLSMSCMRASDSSEPVGEASQAQNLINVRRGPGFNYPIAYQIPPGTALNVTCYTNDPQGNNWYQLGDGNYILASAVPGANVPPCYGFGIRRM